MDNHSAPIASSSQRSVVRFWPWLMVLLVLLFVGFIRVRLLDMPLERDEGEYAYAGQLILQGIPPYELAYNMKLPGTYCAYALGMAAFGQTVAGIRLTLLVVNGLTIIFIFLLARLLGGNLGGVITAASYGVMSVSPTVAGLSAHANHFVVLFAVPATWLLLKTDQVRCRGGVFMSGLLYGLAFLMKQQGLCFGLFGLSFLTWMALRNKEMFSKRFGGKILVFGTGLVLPFALTCLVLALAGVFSRFWFWTFSYAFYYETTIPLRKGIQEYLIGRLEETRDLSIGFWVLVLAGLPAAWLAKPLRPAVFLAVAFWLFSFLGTAAGLYFRGHYFILLLPAFALLLGLAVMALQTISPVTVLPDVFKSLPVIAFSFILSWMIFYQALPFFHWPAVQACQNLYRRNPFVEAVAAGGQIREHSAADAHLAVLGSEPEIYFYARRHSATGYIYTYALMEPQPYALAMQQEMAREIESDRPEYLVQVPYQLSWLPEPTSNHYITGWFEEYARKYYEKVGVAGYASNGKLMSLWGDAATNPPGLAGEYISIYRRKPEPDNKIGPAN